MAKQAKSSRSLQTRFAFRLCFCQPFPMNTLSSTPTVQLSGEAGFVFPGQFPGSFCFVPREFVSEDEQAGFRFDQTGYLLKTWARKNVRLNPGRTVGSHLFPESGSVPLPIEDPSVANFLRQAARLLAE